MRKVIGFLLMAYTVLWLALLPTIKSGFHFFPSFIYEFALACLLLVNYYYFKLFFIDRPPKKKEVVHYQVSSPKPEVKPEPPPQQPQPRRVVSQTDTEMKGSVKLSDVKELEKQLREEVIGQNQAISEVVKRLEFNIKKRDKTGKQVATLGSFMFVGLTGVGKTETARVIGKWAKYKDYQYLMFQMANFSEDHTAATLVGSPRGYVGSEEGGALTRPLMRNPYAILVFDEMEKAHETLYKPMMGLLDDGKIQEVSTGRYAEIKEAIVIFTSNLMQRTIRELSRVVDDGIKREMLIRDVLTGKYDEAVKYVGEDTIEQDLRVKAGKGFPPEFLGRIDKIIAFNELDLDSFAQIIKKTAKNLKVKISDKDALKMARKYQPLMQTYGVRQALRQIEEELLDM